jgi:GNAT superfamily N-acetyltransferase
VALTPVEPGMVATIVTHLEMLDRPRPAPMPAAPLRLVRWKMPDLDAYRTLFRRVGEPWLWFSRLVMPDAALRAIIHHPDVEVFAVTDPRGAEVGLLELDFRLPPDCELSFFGLAPGLTGKGFGQWLMAQAKSLAWRKGVERFWVHTCTLDSPAALSFYIKAGFVPFAREVETFADPRLAGIMPRDAAPHAPLLDR